MATIEAHAPGSFCWAELAAADPPAAQRFYGEVLKWEGVAAPGGYTMLRSDGDDAAGLHRLAEERRQQGVLPHWRVYVAVADADETAARAAQLGGRAVSAPFDVMDLGRIAVLQDPQGAQFGIWQAKAHPGSRAGGVNFRHCWSELATTSAAEAKPFYTRLFGWTVHEQDMGGFVYTTWVNQGAPAGGMLQMTAEWGDSPPGWMVYFSVPSCDDAAAKVAALGGRIHVRPRDIPGVGRFAVLADPQGAVFALIQLAMAGSGSGA